MNGLQKKLLLRSVLWKNRELMFWLSILNCGTSALALPKSKTAMERQVFSKSATMPMLGKVQMCLEEVQLILHISRVERTLRDPKCELLWGTVHGLRPGHERTVSKAA